MCTTKRIENSIKVRSELRVGVGDLQREAIEMKFYGIMDKCPRFTWACDSEANLLKYACIEATSDETFCQSWHDNVRKFWDGNFSRP